MTYVPYDELEFSEVVGSELLENEFKNMKNNTLDFLRSNRFWAIVIGAVSIYLKAKGIIGEPEMLLIATITAGFTVIRTVDRNTGDVTGPATTVSIPSNVTSVSATTATSSEPL